ncbi:MAG TPA: multicopper oxidase domain-containing protein [Dehalococcoidia bacterium]|nr:multicopper oxidase domain-containing protein [Dehalococcoidia bacterium]
MRRWMWASWVAMAVGALAVAGIAFRSDTGSARAATQKFGPPEADVTMEGDWKAVHLTASKFLWQFRDDQAPVEVWGYNNQIPGPTLRFRPGDKVRIYFRNELDEASSIHWHGLVVPNSMDGVGLLTQPGVQPGETFVYEFTIPNTPGTFMYHAHMDDLQQVQMGLTGAFIVDPRDGGDGQYDQDHIMFLNNIAGHYLVNGKEFPNIDPYLVKKGDVIRVRMINMSAIEVHPMHFHGHFTKEIARDGTDVSGSGSAAKVENTVLVAPGQTVDVEVKMNAPGKGAWLFHCHVLTHIMGPDGTSQNLALANGGMVIPVVYTDGLNFDAINQALQDAIQSIQPAPGQTPTAGAAMPAMSASTMQGLMQTAQMGAMPSMPGMAAMPGMTGAAAPTPAPRP